jgi:hypothetical protein
MGFMEAITTTLRHMFGADSTAYEDPRPPAVIASAAREAAVVALETDNWRGAAVAASKLVRDGGEATTPEPWLLYAASAVLHDRPVNAVSSLDVGLRNWVHDPADRAIMLWARATLTQHQLLDPKTALRDFDAARPDCPSWLEDDLAADRKACASKARAKRQLPPEIADHPDYDPLADRDRASAPLPGLVPGTCPSTWRSVVTVLQRPAVGARGPQVWVEDDDWDDDAAQG